MVIFILWPWKTTISKTFENLHSLIMQVKACFSIWPAGKLIFLKSSLFLSSRNAKTAQYWWIKTYSNTFSSHQCNRQQCWRYWQATIHGTTNSSNKIKIKTKKSHQGDCSLLGQWFWKIKHKTRFLNLIWWT